MSACTPYVTNNQGPVKPATVPPASAKVVPRVIVLPRCAGNLFAQQREVADDIELEEHACNTERQDGDDDRGI